MKKEIIITIVIVILIIAGNFISQKYTENSINEINQKLITLKSETINKEKESDELAKETSELYDEWEEKNIILAYYLEHNELEKVNTQIRATKAYFEADLKTDAIPEIEKGIYILEHIKEKQSFCLKNIF